LQRRISASTGGIGTYSDVLAPIGKSPEAWLFVWGKANADRGGDMMGLMSEMLKCGKIDNQSRFVELLKQKESRLEDGMKTSQPWLVSSRLDAKLSDKGKLDDLMEGAEQLDF